MRFDIGNLFRQARDQARRREGPSPGFIMTQPELDKLVELVALECAKTVADPAIYEDAPRSAAHTIASKAITNRLK